MYSHRDKLNIPGVDVSTAELTAWVYFVALQGALQPRAVTQRANIAAGILDAVRLTSRAPM